MHSFSTLHYLTLHTTCIAVLCSVSWEREKNRESERERRPHHEPPNAPLPFLLIVVNLFFGFHLQHAPLEEPRLSTSDALDAACQLGLIWIFPDSGTWRD